MAQSSSHASESNSTRAFAKMLSQDALFFPVSPLFLSNTLKPTTPSSASSKSINHLSNLLEKSQHLKAVSAAASASSSSNGISVSVPTNTNKHLIGTGEKSPNLLQQQQNQQHHHSSNNSTSMKIQITNNISSAASASFATACLPSSTKKSTQSYKPLDSLIASPHSISSLAPPTSATFHKAKAYSSFMEKPFASLEPDHSTAKLIPAQEPNNNNSKLALHLSQDNRNSSTTLQQTEQQSSQQNPNNAISDKLARSLVYDKVKFRNKKHTSIPSKFFAETPITTTTTSEVSVRNNNNSSQMGISSLQSTAGMLSSTFLPHSSLSSTAKGHIHNQQSTSTNSSSKNQNPFHSNNISASVVVVLPSPSYASHKQDQLCMNEEKQMQQAQHQQFSQKLPRTSSKLPKNPQKSTKKLLPQSTKQSNNTSQPTNSYQNNSNFHNNNYSSLPHGYEIPQTYQETTAPSSKDCANPFEISLSSTLKKKHRKMASMNSTKSPTASQAAAPTVSAMTSTMTNSLLQQQQQQQYLSSQQQQQHHLNKEGMFVDFSKNLYNIDMDFKNIVKAQSLSSIISQIHSSNKNQSAAGSGSATAATMLTPNTPIKIINSLSAAIPTNPTSEKNLRHTQTSSCNNSRTITAVNKNYAIEPSEDYLESTPPNPAGVTLARQQDKLKSSLAKITSIMSQTKNSSQQQQQLLPAPLPSPPTSAQFESSQQQQLLNNVRISRAFDEILKQRIDLNTYSDIMDIFNELIQIDNGFSPSLAKFKICLDSMMHSVWQKIESRGKSEDSRAAQSSNDNAMFMSYSTNITSPQISKTPNNVTSTAREYSTKKFLGNLAATAATPTITVANNTPLVRAYQEKQTQTLSEETGADAAELDKSMMREFISEQEKQILAYKEKESTMIKLLIAIKKSGFDIDQIYEKEVLGIHQKERVNPAAAPATIVPQQQGIQTTSLPTHQDNNNDDDDNEQLGHFQSKFLESIKHGVIEQYKNSPSFAGFADESIINDSDESSFNYFGKEDEESNFSNSGKEEGEEEDVSQNLNMNSNYNSLRFTAAQTKSNLLAADTHNSNSKKVFKINLNDLKKEDTQPDLPPQQQQQAHQSPPPPSAASKNQINNNHLLYIEPENEEIDLLYGVNHPSQILNAVDF